MKDEAEIRPNLGTEFAPRGIWRRLRVEMEVAEEVGDVEWDDRGVPRDRLGRVGTA